MLTAVTTETEIFYDLDRTLVCRDVTLSNFLQTLCRELRSQGKIVPEPDETLRKRLAQELFYYRDGNWIPAPPTIFSEKAHDGR